MKQALSQSMFLYIIKFNRGLSFFTSILHYALRKLLKILHSSSRKQRKHNYPVLIIALWLPWIICLEGRFVYVH